MPTPHSLDNRSFVGILKVGTVSPKILFFFKIVLYPLHFYIYFMISLSVSEKKILRLLRDFDGDAVEFMDHFGENFHLRNKVLGSINTGFIKTSLIPLSSVL